MPTCLEPRCPVLVESGRCAAHQTAKDANRQNADVRAWYHRARWKHPIRGLRAQCLRRYPRCVDCRAIGVVEPSTEADHEVPHRGDPRLFWSLANLRGRCKVCHSKKTQRGE